MEEFNKEKGKMTAYTSDKEFKRLKELRNSINEFRVFPRLWAEGVVLTLAVFIFSVILDMAWLMNTNNRTPEMDLILSAFFYIGTFSLFLIGLAKPSIVQFMLCSIWI